MVRGFYKLFVATAVMVPLATFASVTGPVGAIPPSRPICFGSPGTKGDVAIVNLTPVLATAPGDGQLIGFDLYRNPPLAANVNFAPGTVDPNVAFTRGGAKGSVCFINSQHADVELIADQLGTIKGRFYAFAQNNGAPKRVMDTRDSKIIGPRQNRCFKVAGKPGDAAVVNLTPVKASGGGDGQLISSDIKNKPPTAANVNFAKGTVDPNVAIARIGKNNQVCFINSKHSAVHVVADHLGTIKANAYRPARTNGAPKRVLDTRDGRKIQPSDIRCFKVAGKPGDAAVVNLTPVKASAAGDGLLMSSDLRRDPPTAANVNFRRGSVDPNIAIAKIGYDNKVCFVNSKHAAVHLIADHLGTIAAKAYTPARENGAPLRVIDTRTQAEVTPVSAQGPRPVRPSEVRFDCAYTKYDFGKIAEWRTSLTGLDPNLSKDIKLRYPNHPNPNDGNDYVWTITLGKGESGINAILQAAPSDVTSWVSRIEIETYTNIPALHSTTVFDISARCSRGDLPRDLAGSSVPQSARSSASASINPRGASGAEVSRSSP